MSRRVLVCGGRDFADQAFLDDYLNAIVADISHVIVGGAPGADTLAERWARAHCIPFTVYMADWLFHGKAAGPLRNRRMLVEGKPDLVIAFAGGRGTANCLKQAQELGIEVREAKPIACRCGLPKLHASHSDYTFAGRHDYSPAAVQPTEEGSKHR
jgi:YspA, cpYpsA-related SLOG family